MNANMRRLRTKFARETRFEVIPAAAGPSRGRLETDLERLKTELLRQLLRETPYPEFDALFRRAANEAAALAWLAPYPLLVFPGLFEEKTQAAVKHGLRQEYIRRRSLELMADTI
jgi:hypothetical protein